MLHSNIHLSVAVVVVVHEATEQKYCFYTRTMAATRVQVEVAIEYQPPMEHCYLSYAYVLLILAGQLKMDPKNNTTLGGGSLDCIWKGIPP